MAKKIPTDWAARALSGSIVRRHLSDARDDDSMIRSLPAGHQAALPDAAAASVNCCHTQSCCVSQSCCASQSACTNIGEESEMGRRFSYGAQPSRRLWPTAQA